MGCHGNYNDIKIEEAAPAPPPSAQSSLPPWFSLLKKPQQPRKAPHLSRRGSPGNDAGTQVWSAARGDPCPGCGANGANGADLRVVKPPARQLRVGRRDPLPRPGPALQTRFSPLGFRGKVRFLLICLYYCWWALTRRFPAFLTFPFEIRRKKRCFKTRTRVCYHRQTPFALEEYFPSVLSREHKKKNQNTASKEHPTKAKRKILGISNIISTGSGGGLPYTCIFYTGERAARLSSPAADSSGWNRALRDFSDAFPNIFPDPWAGPGNESFLPIFRHSFSAGARGQEFAGRGRRGKPRRLRSEPWFPFLHRNAPDTGLRLGWTPPGRPRSVPTAGSAKTT